MPGTPFREMLTLSDAVELIGRRLYADTWTGFEYASQPRKSPGEIANARKPLEQELAAAEAEIQEIDAAILKTTDPEQNLRLAARRDKLESRIGQLHATLSLDHPLNDIVVEAYNSYVRWQRARETLLRAIREFKLRVHDGHGRELNHLAWTHPKFRYYLDLSLVVVPKSAGEPRWQPARIYADLFKKWAEILPPLVAPKHEPALRELVTLFLRQEFAAMENAPRKTKQELREKARSKFGAALSFRMFEQLWAVEAPPELRKAGAPRKAHRSR